MVHNMQFFLSVAKLVALGGRREDAYFNITRIL